MKKIWAAVFVIAIFFGIYFFEKQKNAAPKNSAAASAIDSQYNSSTLATSKKYGAASAIPSTDIGTNATSPNNLAARAASQDVITATNEILNLPPQTVLDNARVAMHNYNSTFGENPVGTNPEITAALIGTNPKQINFIRPESGLRIDKHGEMVDAFGTPFFFHQLSGHEMEIRSAGDDRKMWTFDDLVTR